jgi:hypothetical protein
VAELEDLVTRRDYKIKPLLRDNCTCGRTLGLLQSEATIKQMCKDNYCRKIYLIKRKCTFCGAIYEYDDMECTVCDVEIEKLTDAEVSVDKNYKLIRRSKRKVKEGKLTQNECEDIIKQAEKEIVVCGEKAQKIREERQIEPSSETQTPKQ